MRDIPIGATGWLDGSYVKIGLHDKVFYYHEGEWLSSSKCAVIVRRDLKNKQNPFRVGE